MEADNTVPAEQQGSSSTSSSSCSCPTSCTKSNTC
uniref:Uncharacterized protein n=1 Tax=Ciona intestinalis TaxID=7719 RepID=H2XMT4_CIOIN